MKSKRNIWDVTIRVEFDADDVDVKDVDVKSEKDIVNWLIKDLRLSRCKLLKAKKITLTRLQH